MQDAEAPVDSRIECCLMRLDALMITTLSRILTSIQRVVKSINVSTSEDTPVPRVRNSLHLIEEDDDLRSLAASVIRAKMARIWRSVIGQIQSSSSGPLIA